MRIRTLPVLLPALALGTVSPASAEVIFAENFSPNLTQLIPGSHAQWFDSRTGTPFAVDAGKYMLETTSASETWLAYLTLPGEHLTVGVGESLTLSMTVSFTLLNSTNTNRHLRLGLFNSNGAVRVSANGFATGTGTGSFDPYSGYSASLCTAQTTGTEPVDIRKRTPNIGNGDLIGSDAASFRLDGRSLAGGVAGSGLVPDQEYVLTFRIARYSETETVITAGYLDVEGYYHSATDYEAGETAFDTFAMRVNTNETTASLITISGFVIERTPAPERPEPVTPQLVATPESSSVRLQWVQPAFRRAIIQAAPTLDAEEWVEIGRVPPTGTNALRDLLAEGALSEGEMYFYRLRVD